MNLLNHHNNQNGGQHDDQIERPSMLSRNYWRPFFGRNHAAPSSNIATPFPVGSQTDIQQQSQPSFMPQQGTHIHMRDQHFMGQQLPRQHFNDTQYDGGEFVNQLAGRQFQSHQFLNSNIYGDMMQNAPHTTIAIHSQEFNDRNETKPRLAKGEVELLERHFQENHKPPSSLKRQLAESMGVGVARINNWFQNRRAKAKQERKMEAQRLDGDHAAEGQEEHDLSDQFPEMFKDDDELFSEAQGELSTTSSPLDNVAVEDAVTGPPMGHERRQRSAVELNRSLLEFSYYDQLGAFEQSSASTTTTASALFASQSSSIEPPSLENLDFGESQQASSFTDTSMVFGMSGQQTLDYSMESRAGADSIGTTFPSEALKSIEQSGNFPAMASDTAVVPKTVESVPEGLTMRFMSPPPAADIASRRSRRRPAPIGIDVGNDRSTPGVRTPQTACAPRRTNKSPGAAIRRVSSVGTLNVLGSRVIKSSAHPSQSPMRQHFPHELRKFSGMSSQVNLVKPVNGGPAPPTPRSPNGQFVVKGESQQLPVTYEHEADQLEMMNSNYFNQCDFGFSPPETPGLSSNGYSWTGYDVSDNAIHTPSIGGFPENPFGLQMPQPVRVPTYVSGPTGFDSLSSSVKNDASGMNFDAYAMQMPQFMSPQISDSSVSPLSSSNISAFNNTMFESSCTEAKTQIGFQWDQNVSDLVPPIQSTPDQSKKPLVFHHATPKDFQGKATGPEA